MFSSMIFKSGNARTVCSSLLGRWKRATNTSIGWVTSQPDYYPSTRWEWAKVSELLASRPPPSKLLEIGCGDGRFLELLRSIRDVASVGLDPTESSAEVCHAKGLRVYAETLSQYVERRPSERRGFDFVVAFHCLEHVSDPIGLMEQMRDMLAPGGRIYVSTPYSPMSWEGEWFDPLNHPPHHMTRWNRRAYEQLSATLGLAPRFMMPPAAPVKRRVLDTFSLRTYGPRFFGRKHASLRAAARHTPVVLAREYMRQCLRERLGGTVTANVVLVEMSATR